MIKKNWLASVVIGLVIGLPLVTGAATITELRATITRLQAELQKLIQGQSVTSPLKATGVFSPLPPSSIPPLHTRVISGSAPVVFIGDSIMAGAGAPVGGSIEQQFSSLTGATVRNSGVSGNTTSQIAARFTTDVLNFHPQMVVIEGGVNDLASGSVSKETFLANWTTMLDAAQASSDITKIVVLKILPWTNGNNAALMKRDDWNASLTDLASRYSKAVVVDASAAVGQFRAGGTPGNLWDMQAAYKADNVHFNAQGHLKIAETIIAALPSQQPTTPTTPITVTSFQINNAATPAITASIGAGKLVENIVYDSTTRQYWWIMTDRSQGAPTIRLARAEVINGPWQEEASILFSGHAPFIVNFDGTWYIYYRDENMNIVVRSSSQVNTGYGASVIVLTKADTGWDSGRVDEPWVGKVGSSYTMLYMGGDDRSLSNNENELVGVAIGNSPIGPFVRSAANPVLRGSNGGLSAWNSGKDKAGDPYAFQIDNNWYVGVTASAAGKSGWNIGFFQTTDFVNFQPVSPANPILKRGLGTSWDSGAVLRGGVTKVGDIYYVSYTGSNGMRYQGGLSVLNFSPDSITLPNLAITSLSGPTELQIGEEGEWDLQLTSSANTVLRYSVNWGDLGPLGAANTVSAINNEISFRHTYVQAGTYTVKFTVRANSGIQCFRAPCPSEVVTEKSLLVTVKAKTNSIPADLKVTQSFITNQNFAEVLTGKLLIVRATMTNIGSSTIGNIPVEWLLDGQVIKRGAFNQTLAQGASVTGNGDLDWGTAVFANLEPGLHHLRFIVKPVVGSNEDNSWNNFYDQAIVVKTASTSTSRTATLTLQVNNQLTGYIIGGKNMATNPVEFNCGQVEEVGNSGKIWSSMSCSQTYPIGTTITLVASGINQASGNNISRGIFGGWGNACSQVGVWRAASGITFPSCEIVLTANKTIPLIFTPSLVPPMSGRCGLANGAHYDTQINLGQACNPGIASPIINTATGWQWTCPGINGGSTASCSALKNVATVPVYTPASLQVSVSTKSMTVGQYNKMFWNAPTTLSSCTLTADGELVTDPFLKSTQLRTTWSFLLTPTKTTTYVLTCGGVSSLPVTVKVVASTAPVSVSKIGQMANILEGMRTLLEALK